MSTQDTCLVDEFVDETETVTKWRFPLNKGRRDAVLSCRSGCSLLPFYFGTLLSKINWDREELC